MALNAKSNDVEQAGHRSVSTAAFKRSKGKGLASFMYHPRVLSFLNFQQTNGGLYVVLPACGKHSIDEFHAVITPCGISVWRGRGAL